MSRFGTFTPGRGEQRVDVHRFLKEENRAFFVQFTEEITKELVDRLRIFFELHPRVPPEFRFVWREHDGEKCDTDQVNSKIHIGVEGNNRERMFPAVLVRDVSGNILDLYMAQKMGDLVTANPAFAAAPEPDSLTGDPEKPPEFLELGERLGGKVDMQVTLNLESKSRAQVDILADLVLYSLVGPIRRELHKKGMNWLPNRGTLGGVTTEQYTAQELIYRRLIGFGLQVEWYDDFYYEGVTVEAIQDSVITLLPAQ